jgi:alanyl aminopeptidase
MKAFRNTFAAILAGALALAACVGSPLIAPPLEPFNAPTAPDGTPLGRLSLAATPIRYVLELTIDPSEPRFSGAVEIEYSQLLPSSTIQLHGDALEVTEAYVTLSDGRRVEARYEQRNDTGSAVLVLAEPVPTGFATIHMAWTAPYNTANNGLFRQERDGLWYAATQFEPAAARMVFPGFDQPDFKTIFDVAITARARDAVITNSPEVAAEDLGNGWTRHVFAQSEPLPTYLIAIAVGPYDVVTWEPIPPNALRENPLPLRGVAVRGLGERIEHALAHTAALVGYLEDYFGTPYPYAKLDLIAMPSSFGGAMENAGAITYDEIIVLLDARSPVDQRLRHTRVHAHELAHMWFGDLVTPEWWTDIWLNEAFATWMGNKAARTQWPQGELDLETMRRALNAMAEDSLASARRIREPVVRDAEIISAFDSITYQKGGGVLAMLEAYVGEEAFREGVRVHMRRFPHDVANTDDFMESIAAGADDPELVGAFRSFIDQKGVPLLEAQLECPARGSPRVRVRQSRYRPLGSEIEADGQLWRIPACVSYTADGSRGRACALVTRREQTIPLDAMSCPDSIHPNAGGAGYYRFALDEAGWAALAGEISTLPTPEALAMLDSLDAAYRAGVATTEAYVDGLVALAAHPAWQVAEVVAERLEEIVEILDVDQLEAAKPGLAAIARDRYAGLESAESDSDVLLRAVLGRFLAIIAEDPEVRGAMTAQAAERIGVRGAPDWSHIDPDLLSTTLSVGVQELDDRFFELVLAEGLASSDPTFRSDALGALARVEDPVLAARFRDTLLSERFRGEEAINMIARQLGRDETEDATWAWIQANASEVIEVAPEIFRSPSITDLGQVFCSAERSAEFAVFIVGNAELLPGYERGLAQAQEKIALCAALREASADELTAALARLGN